MWRNVEIEVEDVDLLFAKVSGNQFHSISNDVKLLRFSEKWCIEINGVYDYAEYPKTLEEILKHGDCYVTGQRLSIKEM